MTRWPYSGGILGREMSQSHCTPTAMLFVLGFSFINLFTFYQTKLVLLLTLGREAVTSTEAF